MLHTEPYAGTAKFTYRTNPGEEPQIRTPAAWPAIIPQEHWDAVHERLQTTTGKKTNATLAHDLRRGFERWGRVEPSMLTSDDPYWLTFKNRFPGGVFPNSDARQAYTAVFDGTSAAAPIVTGAAAIIQGVRRARGLPDLTSQQMRAALQVGATPQGSGPHIGSLPDLCDAIAAIPLSPPTIAATGNGNATATVTWGAVSGATSYEVFRRPGHAAAWTLIHGAASSPFTDTGLTPGASYLYRVRSHDAVGTRSPDSNYEIATTITFTDTPVAAGTTVRAKHIVEVRTAVNALCAYAGSTICASPPFTGSSLDENHVRTQFISAADFVGAQSQIASPSELARPASRRLRRPVRSSRPSI